MIGISVDALSHKDNLALGRVNGSGKTLSPEQLELLGEKIHENNIRFKVNTVVNKINCHEDFSGMIRQLSPERWKLLRMIAIEGKNDTANDLLISDEKFEEFALRHKALSPVVEDTKDIVSAYIVVNPKGQLVDNSSGSYKMSRSLLTSTFGREFPKVAFNLAAYEKRY